MAIDPALCTSSAIVCVTFVTPIRARTTPKPHRCAENFRLDCITVDARRPLIRVMTVTPMELFLR
jgi:hypothetical protein